MEGADRLLQTYPRELSASAERALIELGVRTRAGARVTAIDGHGVTAQTPECELHIAARTVLWAAGVQASPLGKLLGDRTGVALDTAGRVCVDPDRAGLAMSGPG